MNNFPILETYFKCLLGAGENLLNPICYIFVSDRVLWF